MEKKNHAVIATIAISLLLLLTAIIATISLSLPPPLLANGQPDKPLPVLFIHGYRSTHNVWDEWEDKLSEEGIYTKAITFPRNDECGSAMDHATQLNQIVRDFKEEARAEKINIVAHSKGGLDARVYLANNPSSDDVANLIMIGTPNEGSPLADHYYRNSVYLYRPPFWILDDINCPSPSNWFDLEGWNFLAFQYNGEMKL